MLLENDFYVPLSKSIAMEVLTDVALIAPCIPGVTITETSNDKLYKGEATVRLGPVKLVFSGTGEIIEIDNEKHEVRVKAGGSDKKGRGGAEATVFFKLSEVEDAGSDGVNTQVSVTTNLNLNGAIAQYGRASGLIESVAVELTKEFAQNLEKVLTMEDGNTLKANEISGLKILMKVGVKKLRLGGNKSKNETSTV
jgi:carbon monoxide dehydrogenase subunit G